MKRIVIIGGGYSGILTAKKLEKRFRRTPDAAAICVIDKNPYHTMLTELHEVAAGRVDEESIRISYRKVFAGRRIEFLHDTAESFDFKAKKVRCAHGDVDYDYLVIASGSRPTYFGIPGAAEHAFPLWSYDDAVRLQERIHNSFRRASSETDEAEKRRLLTFYVVGAGFTGVEMAGELAEYAPFLCDTLEVDRKYVSIFNVDFLPRVVPNLPEKLSEKIEQRLARMGVSVLLNTKVMEVGENSIERGEGRRPDKIATPERSSGSPASRARPSRRKPPRISPARRRGRLVADSFLRSADDPSRLHCTGDNLYYVPEGADAPVPQMVENCEQSSDTVAHGTSGAP